METTRIIIAGGRNFRDYEMLKRNMRRFLKVLHMHYEFHKVEIISGGAKGADALGERFAQEFGYDLKIMKADWDQYGKRAGYIRNMAMVDYALESKHSFLVAFWDGKSKGTSHMIDIARNKLKNVDIVFYKGLT